MNLADRRQEEKLRRRGEILDAAEAVAAAVGVEEMTMDRVARKARLSRALLYVYFGDKFDLSIAICERGLAVLKQRFEVAAAAQQRGLDQVVACGRAYVEFAREQPVYFSALSMLEAHSPEIAAKNPNEMACKATGDQVHAVIIRGLTRGLADGSVRRDLGEPKLVALALWGFMHGIIQIAFTKGDLLAYDGLSAAQLIEQGLALCARSLEPRT